MYLVTGGAGFIGSCVATALAARGSDVAISDRLGTGLKWLNLAQTRAHEIFAPEQLDHWLAARGKGLKGIVHMGAISATTEQDTDALVANNIQLTLKLWTFATLQHIPLIFASSASIYGGGEADFEDSEEPGYMDRFKPLNGYAWSKLVVDKRIAQDVANGRARPPQWAALRFFNVYGPNEDHKGDMRSVINKIYPDVAAGRPVQLFKSHKDGIADGGQSRDFIYVRDCVNVVLWLLDTPGVSGIFNVGSGVARSFNDLANSVGNATGQSTNIEYIDMPVTLRERYQYFTQANIQKILRAGYQCGFTSLEDGVKHYVETHLSRI